MKKLSQLYLDARRILLKTEDPQTAGMYARELLSFATGKSREQLVADMEMYASQGVCDAMDRALDRLLQGEPLAYILGQWEFFGLTLSVDRGVLIPRDDTCAVTELAIGRLQDMTPPARVLDLCTGSGCIGLAVASKVPTAKVILADISEQALATAKKNAAFHHLNSRVSCIRADALSTPPLFLGKVDMIVSNPPYITAEEMKALPKSVAEFEPHLALFGGEDGLDFYRGIIENYTQTLKPGGYLALEFGMGQGDAVCALLEAKQYTILERSRDYNDRERAVIAQYGRKEI